MRDEVARLRSGNQRYHDLADQVVQRLRVETARNGQHPYAIIVCCSDSRVIPEHIFSAQLGDLFVIRVAGNVLDNHQIGSIEYAAAHLGTHLVVLLGHTGCGAVAAALEGGAEGYIKYITDDILEAIGDEKDPAEACRLNVLHGVGKLKEAFHDHPEIEDVTILGAIYDIGTGKVEFTEG